MSLIRISFILIVPFMVLFSGEGNLFCLHWQNFLVLWKNLFQITKTLMANCRGCGWLAKWKTGPLPFVPLFSHAVVPQWPVEPPQVHHGHMMAWAKFDGLLVMGHCLFWKACNQRQVGKSTACLSYKTNQLFFFLFNIWTLLISPLVMIILIAAIPLNHSVCKLAHILASCHHLTLDHLTVHFHLKPISFIKYIIFIKVLSGYCPSW